MERLIKIHRQRYARPLKAVPLKKQKKENSDYVRFFIIIRSFIVVISKRFAGNEKTFAREMRKPFTGVVQRFQS